MLDIIRQCDTSELSRTAVRALSDALRLGGNQGILLLLSGGSALSLVKNMEIPEAVTNLSLGMIDERYDTDPSINNFLLLKQTQLYRNTESAGASIIESVPHEGESLHDFSARIALQWESWLSAYPAGKIIVLLGVGPDGHTAGVFPFPEDRAMFESLFVQTPHALVGYDSHQKNIYPKRITATLALLKFRVDEAIVFMSGESKNSALQDILKDEGELNRTPARIVREMKHVQLFTDIRDTIV